MVTCEVSNKSGQTVTSGTLRVASDKAIESGTHHPKGTSGLETIAKLEQQRMAASFNLSGAEGAEPESGEKPVFVKPLDRELNVPKESTKIDVTCNVEPKNDAALKITWFHNGKTLKASSRIKATTDFGQVRLLITDISGRDEGVYTCKATNQWGEATTFTTVRCSGKSGLDLATKHPKGSEGLEAISKLESSVSAALLKDGEDADEEDQAPQFLTQLTTIACREGSVAYNEAMVIPKRGGSHLTIEWLKDSKPLAQSKFLTFL